MDFRRTLGKIAVVVIAIIVITLIGLNFSSEITLTVIVGAAGVTVSVITYIYQSRQLKQVTLFEVFKVLNLPEHREARKVTYGEKTDASYDILKITRPEEDGAPLGEIERSILLDIPRNYAQNSF